MTFGTSGASATGVISTLFRLQQEPRPHSDTRDTLTVFHSRADNGAALRPNASAVSDGKGGCLCAEISFGAVLVARSPCASIISRANPATHVAIRAAAEVLMLMLMYVWIKVLGV